MAEKKLPKKMPWVTPVSCEGCGDCVHHCARNGLKMTETNVKNVYVPWLDEPELCVGCGQCAAACTWGAISMTTYVEMAYNRFKNQRPTIPTD